MQHAAAENLQPSSPSPKRDFAAPWAAGTDVDSIEGSVNGKKDGRNRIFTFFHPKNALQNLQHPLPRWPMGCVRSMTRPSTWWNCGVGRVRIDAVRAPRADDAGSAASADSMVRTCIGEVCVRRSLRASVGFGLEKNVSCIRAPGWPSGSCLVKL